MDILVIESENVGEDISLNGEYLGKQNTNAFAITCIIQLSVDISSLERRITYYYSVKKLSTNNYLNAFELHRDLSYLYKSIMSLDGVQKFVKIWDVADCKFEDTTSLSCVYKKDGGLIDGLKLNENPGVHVFLPLNVMTGMLKAMAEKALRETYCSIGNINVSYCAEYEGDDDNLFVIEPNAGNTIDVIGPRIEMNDISYEGGCVACDICGAVVSIIIGTTQSPCATS